MRKEILALSLAAAVMLTGCGSIEDEDIPVKGNARAAVTESGETESDSEDTSQTEDSSLTNDSSQTESIDPRQQRETQQTESPPDSSSVQEPETQTGDVLTPENITGYMFGFELFNNGHINCWDSRYECAKVMLEAIAQPGADTKTIDHVPDVYELNAKETNGFMTWLKFEEPMSFRVGDTVMSGNTLNIVDYNGAYCFYIGEFEEISCMMEFESSYIPKLLAAAGSPADTQDIQPDGGGTESVPDLSSTHITITSSGAEYTGWDAEGRIMEEVIMATLDAVSDGISEEPDRHLDYMIAEKDPSAFYMMFDFGKPTRVRINGSEREIYLISLGGSDAQGYLVNINNETVYSIDRSIVGVIKDIIRK